MDHDDPPLTRELNVLETLSLRPDRYVFFCTPADEAITAGQHLHLPIRGEESEAFTVLEAMPLENQDDTCVIVVACVEPGRRQALDEADLRGATLTLSLDQAEVGTPPPAPLVPVSQDEKLDHYFVDMRLRGVPRRIANPWFSRWIRGFYGKAPPLVMMPWLSVLLWFGISAVLVCGGALQAYKITQGLLFLDESYERAGPRGWTPTLAHAGLAGILFGAVAALVWWLRGRRIGLGYWHTYRGIGRFGERNVARTKPDDWY